MNLGLGHHFQVFTDVKGAGMKLSIRMIDPFLRKTITLTKTPVFLSSGDLWLLIRSQWLRVWHSQI